MTHRSLAAVVLIGLIGFGTPASADGEDAIPGHTIERSTNAGITGVALGLGLVSQLLPIRRTELWRTEFASIDEDVHDNFSRRAASLSDATLGLSLAAPALYLVGTTIDDADGDKLLIYGQSIAVNALLGGITKRLVQRPRPYMYSKDPRVQRYAKDQGDDGYLSFYSGHAALSFGAAVTGAYLLGASGASRPVRALAWSGGMMVAASTANLRVRAGKHFYTDVIIGGIVGMSVGYLVPALHADGDPYRPSGEELAAGAAGIVGGLLLSSLLPLEKRTREADLSKPGVARGLVHDLRLTPMPVTSGFGLAIGGGM